MNGDFLTGAIVGGVLGAYLSPRSSARPGAAGYDISLSVSTGDRLRCFHVPDSEPRQHRCAWCDDAAGIRVTGNVSHQVCIFHRIENLRSCLGDDHEETFFACCVALLGGQSWGDDFWRSS